MLSRAKERRDRIATRNAPTWPVIAITGQVGALRVAIRSRRSLALLSIAAVLIGVNWLTYVFAVLADHVIEASLGYFINPLVTCLLYTSDAADDLLCVDLGGR